MMKLFILLFSCIFFGKVYAVQSEVPVFVSGEEGYKSFRIPAIICLPNHDLLAFCEGRVDHAGDFGHINMVMKRSSDNGKTWSPLKVVARNGDLQVSNPAPVIDCYDPSYPNGRIFLFYNTGNMPETDIVQGRGDKRCWFITSADGGESWSEPVDITMSVKKKEWRYYANTPGHAIQLQQEKYRGRIYVAANHSSGDPKSSGKHYQAHGYYTDDHGKSFHLSSNIDYQGSNESMVAELSSGELLMNSRNQSGSPKARLFSLSKNGGETWETPRFDFRLIDPVCQGSILSFDNHRGTKILAFCNAADTLRRNNLTLRISYDGGKSWAKDYLIYGKNEQTKPIDYAAYSDLVLTGDSQIGILYEKDNYSKIVFTTVKP